MLAGLAAPVGAQPLDEPLDERGLFEVRDTDVAQRTTIADSGVDVWGVHDGTMTFAAEPEQVQKLRAAGLDLVRIGDLDRMLADHNPGVRAAADEFPPGDEAYHTYTELTEVLRQTVSDHGDIAKLTSIGKSYEGRDLHLITISGNVEVDEDEPEVLFTCNQHAREHLTTEMCLRIIQRFTDEYGQDPTVTELVDTREIHVIPTVNPDGAEYDIEGGRYRGWRKNRQGNGTDLNRNWGYQWGCCGGSSGSIPPVRCSRPATPPRSVSWKPHADGDYACPTTSAWWASTTPSSPRSRPPRSPWSSSRCSTWAESHSAPCCAWRPGSPWIHTTSSWPRASSCATRRHPDEENDDRTAMA